METRRRKPGEMWGMESAGAAGAPSPFAVRLPQGNPECSISNGIRECSSQIELVCISACFSGRWRWNGNTHANSLKRSSVRYKEPQRGVLLKLKMQFVAFPWHLPQKCADLNIKKKRDSLGFSKRAEGES